jgi:hypothetical protein
MDRISNWLANGAAYSKMRHVMRVMRRGPSSNARASEDYFFNSALISGMLFTGTTVYL